MLPNLIVIGAEKAGTTSMHYYLGLHPQIFASKSKELNFFLAQRNWLKGLDWYKAQFPEQAGILTYVDSSPNYTEYPECIGVPERMHEIIPEAKLIYIVRDPIERTISDYFHHYFQHKEDRPLETVLQEDEKSSYVLGSRYYERLQPFLAYYSEECILIVDQHELKANRQTTLQAVFRFVGVDEDFYSAEFDTEKNVAGNRRRRTKVGHEVMGFLYYSLGMRHLPTGLKNGLKAIFDRPFTKAIEKPEISPEVQQRLADLLKDDADQFRQFTGQTFAHWKV